MKALARLFGRELQKWEPDGDEAALEDLSIDSTPRGKGGRWDQFEANRRQFGVRTSFNEDVSPQMWNTSMQRGSSVSRKRGSTVYNSDVM